MVWILLEALAALLVAIFIVWWTMAPKKKRPLPPSPGKEPQGPE